MKKLKSKCEYCNNIPVMYNEETGNYLCIDHIDIVLKEWMKTPPPKNSICALCKCDTNLINMRAGPTHATMSFILCWDCAHKIIKYQSKKLGVYQT